MVDSTEEKVKKLKEISDLKSEIQKTEKLLREGQIDELSVHLRSLNKKYFLETSLYNMLHPFLPKSTQENAQNCVNFLSTLLAEKVADIGEKS